MFLEIAKVAMFATPVQVHGSVQRQMGGALFFKVTPFSVSRMEEAPLVGGTTAREMLRRWESEFRHPFA